MNSGKDDENNYYVDSSNEQNSKSRLVVVSNYKYTLSIHTNSYKLKDIDLEEKTN